MKRHDASQTTRRDVARLRPELLRAAAALPVATLHEAAGRIGALPSGIKPVVPKFRFAGCALTVHSPGGDNLWLHRALEVAQAGDVLVVSVNGEWEYGYWGEIMTTMAQTRGLAGLVLDGCVRDGGLLAEIGFPVFARGLCIRGTGKDFGAMGWINHPVMIGDVVVHAGDLIAGDVDGVVVIPEARAEQTLQAAVARERQEAAILERLKAGDSTMACYGWSA